MLPRLSIRCAPAVLLACIAGAAQAGQPTIQELVDALKAPEFSVREEATRSLSARSDIKQVDIEAAMKADGLTAEQRARLAVAARDRFVRSPRAALGVEFAQNPALPNQAIISKTIPGFPSARELLPEDEIISLNGIEAGRLQARSVFRPIIISREPGDLLRMTILRKGELIERDVPVGRYEDLQRNPVGASSPLLRQDLPPAWMARSLNYPLAPVGGAIDCAMPIDQWLRAVEQAKGPDPRVQKVAEALAGATVSPGGQVHGPLPVAMVTKPTNGAQVNAFDPWQMGANEQPAVLPIRPGDGGAQRAAGMALNTNDPMQDMMTGLQIQREQIRAQAKMEGQKVQDATLPEAERQMARTRQIAFEMQMRAIDSQIDTMRRMMQNRRMIRP